MTNPTYLYGLHDPGGEHLMADAPGTVVYTVDVRSDAPIDFRAQAGLGYRAIVRLNWSHHGQGTIPPHPADWPRFAESCALFVAGCRGVRDITIANEPNIRAEWGRDEPVTPEQYADCYRLVYRAVKARVPQAQIAPAAIGPWNVESGIDWITWFRRMLAAIGPEFIDWLNLHTYARGYDPRSVTDNSFMDRPYGQYRKGFRAYWDFLDAVPAGMRALPVDITEANGNEQWPNANTGWVQAAYAEIDRHNRLAGTQKIRSLCLFRWQHFDGQPWGIEKLGNVHADFRAAVAKKYAAPESTPRREDAEKTTLNLPAVPVGNAPALPTRDWDERLTQRGIELTEHTPRPGELYWRLVKGEYWTEKEHTFAETLDASGNRQPGVAMRWWWSNGEEEKRTEFKPGDRWMVDFPMYASGHSYGLEALGHPSDRVFGMGLGSVEQPHMGIHVSYKFVFQLTRAAQSQTPAPVQPEPPAAPTVPALVHPVQDPAFRVVSQHFGVNPQRYARFNLDGHNGVDFAVPVGRPIVAVADGDAVEVLNDPGGYGLYVKLRHAWGETLYAHLSQQLIGLAGRVYAGEVIGLSGNTGNSTGPHLHFGLRVHPYTRGRPFDGYSDPLPYLQQMDATPPAGESVDIVQTLRAAAREFGLSEALLLSLAWAESSFNPAARSPAGALGLCQIMPGTWDEWATRVGAVDILHPPDNARVGAAYLDWCIRQAGGVYRGLVAYNWGIGHLLAGREIPAETATYAAKVLHGRDLLEAVEK